MKELNPGTPTRECYEEWERRKEHRRLNPTDKDKMERLKRGPSYQPWRNVPMPKEDKYWIRRSPPSVPEPEQDPQEEKKDACTCQCACGFFPKETTHAKEESTDSKAKDSSVEPESND